MNLDQRQARSATVDLGVHRLDQGTLAHAAGAPQERIVGRQAGGEAVRVVEQNVAHPVDSAQQGQRHPAHLGDRMQAVMLRLPDEGGRGLKVVDRGRCRGQPLQRLGDAVELAAKVVVEGHARTIEPRRLSCHDGGEA